MTRRLLIPKEHGTWGELLFPLVTALFTGSLAAPAVGMAMAALAGFLSSEGIQTLAGWRGPRARRELQREARLSAGVFLSIALIGGAWAFDRAAAEVRLAVTLAGALTVVVIGVAASGRLRTAGGEVLAALALGAWSVPTAMAGGGSWRAAVGMWLLWGVVFGSGTLAVRALIARQTRRDGRAAAVTALGLIGLASGVLLVLVRDRHVSGAVLAGFLPAALLIAAVALAPIPARRLRWVGWSLVAASTLVFAALVGVRG
jgi:hypothetical protein